MIQGDAGSKIEVFALRADGSAQSLTDSQTSLKVRRVRTNQTLFELVGSSTPEQAGLGIAEFTFEAEHLGQDGYFECEFNTTKDGDISTRFPLLYLTVRPDFNS